MKAAAGRADVVISDVIDSAFFTRVQAPAQVFGQLRQLGRLAVAFDTLGEQSLHVRMPEAAVDLVVVPYVAPQASTAGGGWRMLQGARYAVLPAEYAGLPVRAVRAVADRVLISCGGSDPQGHTLTVMQGLEALTPRLHVKIAVGPLFSDRLRTQIEGVAADSKHQVELMQAPVSLLEPMLWCDLAIAASGLTKYELAASRTPALLFSIDRAHDEINQPFAALGTALDLGIDIRLASVARAARSLLANAEKRQAMADIGGNLVDGQGIARLTAEIRKELSC
jgi:spore coat polysaccharide biosynthesis predicted glycosyltransferase SpsG